MISKKYLRIWIFPIFLTFVTVLSIECFAATSLPTRRDCIVELFSKNSAILDFRRDDIGSVMKVSKIMNFSLAGYGVKDSNTAFLQFSRNCDHRIDMSRILVTRAFPKNSVLINFKKVNPGLNTVDISGNSWRDGNRNFIK